MFALRLIIAAGSLTTLISGAPVPSFLSLTKPHTQVVDTPSSVEERDTANSYTIYGGNGSPTEGWPTMSAWASFDTMFSNNQAVMSASCAQFNVPDNTASEIADIKSAITAVGSSTGIDPRFILAILMQESNGCVRAPTTNYGVRNPGLMQSHNGAGTCNDASVANPCPASEITQMITDGAAGTASGDGLKQCLAESGATDVSMYYIAARIYNSGSVDSTKNLGAGIATHCYSSDIANRLTGWFSGPSGCSPGTIASFTGVTTVVSGDSGSAAAPAESSAPASTSTTAGGVFAALPTNTPSPVAPAPIVQTATSVVPTPTVTPSPVTPATATSTILVVPTPVATSTPVAPSTSSSSGAIAAGTACSTDGLWNCVDGTSFQQCGSGIWSAVQSLAAGVQCTTGQSATIDISIIAQ